MMVQRHSMLENDEHHGSWHVPSSRSTNALSILMLGSPQDPVIPSSMRPSNSCHPHLKFIPHSLYGAVGFFNSSPSTRTLLSAVAGSLSPLLLSVPNFAFTPPLPTLTVL